MFDTTAIQAVSGFGMPGQWELLLLLVLILIIFGPKRLPQLSRSIGKSITDFKKGLNDIKDDIENAGQDEEEEKKEKPKPAAKSEKSAETSNHEPSK